MTRCYVLNSTADAFNRHTRIISSETRSWRAATTRYDKAIRACTSPATSLAESIPRCGHAGKFPGERIITWRLAAPGEMRWLLSTSPSSCFPPYSPLQNHHQMVLPGSLIPRLMVTCLAVSSMTPRKMVQRAKRPAYGNCTVRVRR